MIFCFDESCVISNYGWLIIWSFHSLLKLVNPSIQVSLFEREWQYGLSHRLNGDVRPRTSHEADLYSAFSRLFSLRHVGPGTVLHASLWTFFMFHNIVILIYRHEDRYSGHHFGKGSCLWIEGANSCLHISPRFSNVFLHTRVVCMERRGSIYPLLLVICIVLGYHRE